MHALRVDPCQDVKRPTSLLSMHADRLWVPCQVSSKFLSATPRRMADTMGAKDQAAGGGGPVMLMQRNTMPGALPSTARKGGSMTLAPAAAAFVAATPTHAGMTRSRHGGVPDHDQAGPHPDSHAAAAMGADQPRPSPSFSADATSTGTAPYPSTSGGSNLPSFAFVTPMAARPTSFVGDSGTSANFAPSASAMSDTPGGSHQQPSGLMGPPPPRMPQVRNAYYAYTPALHSGIDWSGDFLRHFWRAQ